MCFGLFRPFLPKAHQRAVHLRAHDKGHGAQVQPDQKDDDRADGAVQQRIVGNMLHIPGIQPAQAQPARQGCQGARPDVPPGLAAVLGQGVQEKQGKISYRRRQGEPQAGPQLRNEGGNAESDPTIGS